MHDYHNYLTSTLLKISGHLQDLSHTAGEEIQYTITFDLRLQLLILSYILVHASYFGERKNDGIKNYNYDFR